MRFLILDDHTLFSEGLSNLMTGNFDDLAIARFKRIADIQNQRVDISRYDLIISDLGLPNENIFQFLQHTITTYPKVPILVVSMHSKFTMIKQCLHLKIQGYILKDDDVLLIEAVQSILNGENYYSPRVLATYKKGKESIAVLTPREEEILKLISEGKRDEVISNELFISINTLKTHKKNIKQKLELSTPAELVKYTLEHII